MPSDKNSRKENLLYVADEDNIPVLTLVVLGKGWNKYYRESDSPDATLSTANLTQMDSPIGPSRPPVDISKHCKYHDIKRHATTECKSLYAQFLSSVASGDFKIEPPKVKPKAKTAGAGIRIRKLSESHKANPARAISDQRARSKLPNERKMTTPPLTRNNIRIGNDRGHSCPLGSSSDEESDLDIAPEPTDLRTLLKRKFASSGDNTL